MMIPTIVSISLMLTYPIYKIFRLMKLDTSLLHTLPRIERNCKLSFIRENMMLAVVLDSFCITNYEYLCKRNIFFPRIMGATTLFFQDIPQLLLHGLFLWVIHTDVPHAEFTVSFSLFTSVFAIMVSLFNVLVSHPNHFDPVLLKKELDKRKSKSYKMTSRRVHAWGNESNEQEDSKSVRRDSLFDIEESKEGYRNADREKDSFAHDSQQNRGNHMNGLRRLDSQPRFDEVELAKIRKRYEREEHDRQFSDSELIYVVSQSSEFDSIFPSSIVPPMNTRLNPGKKVELRKEASK